MKITLLEVKITLRHRVLQQLSARRVQQRRPRISPTQGFTHRVLTTFPPLDQPPALLCMALLSNRGDRKTSQLLPYPRLCQALPSAHFPAEHL